MSVGRSIDGLQRRKPTSSTSAAIKKVKKTTKKVIVKNEKVSDSSLKKTTEKSNSLGLERPKNKKASLNDAAVKEFLNEINDSDPTDLTDIPKKERKKEKKKHSKKKIIKRIIIVLLVLIVGIVAVVYFILDDFIASVTDGGSVIGLVFSDPDTPLETDSNGRTNFLIFGTEGYDMNDPNYDGGYLTDSMMLVSLDQDSGDIKAVSLPRDLKWKTCFGSNKLNEVFYCKYQKTDNTEENNKKYEKEGAKALQSAFEEVLGVSIQYYAHLNWEAAIEIIDAVGGVDVVFTYDGQTWDGDETIIETTSPNGLGDKKKDGSYAFEYPNGKAIHLTGAQAVRVARTRNSKGGYGAALGNFSREYFQQRIIEAAIKSAKKKNIDISTVISVKNAIGDNLRTNFKDTEIKTLVKLATSIDMSSIETISLYTPEDNSPLLTTGMINKISYVYPTAGVSDYSAIQKYIAKKLSNSFSAEGAKIAVMNGTNAYGIAANEKTELENAGFYDIYTANAPSDLSGFDGIKIYQLSSKSLTKTKAAIEKQYPDTQIETTIPESLSSYSDKYDFIIIIGNGHSSSSK